jgi:ubiquinone/menaquinone biosynthesis C-methylase UbiE
MIEKQPRQLDQTSNRQQLSPRQKLFRKRQAEEWERYKDDISCLYRVWNTPIPDYAKPLKLDVERLLLKELARAKKKGVPLRGLDVGIGSGKEWLDFAEKHGIAISDSELDLRGSVLLSDYVYPEFHKRTVMCLSSQLAENFPLNHFDIVLTHFGMNGEEFKGLRAIHQIARPGGIVVAVGETKHMPSFGAFGRLFSDDFMVIERAYDSLEGVGYYLRKKK